MCPAFFEHCYSCYIKIHQSKKLLLTGNSEEKHNMLISRIFVVVVLAFLELSDSSKP